MAESEDHEKDDSRCGLLCFKPDWLQRLKTPACALLAVSFAAFIQGTVSMI